MNDVDKLKKHEMIIQYNVEMYTVKIKMSLFQALKTKQLWQDQNWILYYAWNFNKIEKRGGCLHVPTPSSDGDGCKNCGFEMLVWNLQ